MTGTRTALVAAFLLAACIQQPPAESPVESMPDAYVSPSHIEPEAGGGRVVERFDEAMHVTVPRLSTGLAVLVETPGGALLVDAGTQDVDFLDGVQNLRFVASSTSGSRTYSCPGVFQHGAVAFYHASPDASLPHWQACLESAQGTPVLTNETLAPGSAIRIDANTYATILHIDVHKGVLALRVDYGATSLVLAGSLDCSGEMAILESGLDVDADVLQLGARGGCREWLDAVSPGHVFFQEPPPRRTLESVGGAQVHDASQEAIRLQSDGRTVVTR